MIIIIHGDSHDHKEKVTELILIIIPTIQVRK